MKAILFILAACLCSSLAYSQIRVAEQVEIPINHKEGDSYRVFPIVDKGVVCLFQSNQFIKGAKRKLVFTFYDTVLVKTWETSFVVSETSNILENRIDGGYLYLLMSKPGKKYDIIRIDAENGTVALIDFDGFEGFSVSFFEVVDGKFFLGGEMKGAPLVLSYNYAKKEYKAFPALNQLKAELKNIALDRGYGLLSVVMESEVLSSRRIYVSKFDFEGNIKGNFSFEPAGSYRLLSFDEHIVGENEQMLIGAYSLGYNEGAQGVYISKFNNGSQEYIRFYDFGYLKNFFNYLPEKKRDKTLNGIFKKRQKNKIKKLNYSLLVHDIKVNGDDLFFVAEAVRQHTDKDHLQNSASRYTNTPYYRHPSHITNENLAPGQRYQPSWLVRRKIIRETLPTDYFEYTHAFVCNFNRNSGKLSWDNVFAFPLKTHVNYPVQVIDIAVGNFGVKAICHTDQEVLFKEFEKSQWNETTTGFPLPKKDEDDKVYEFENGGLIHWYQNNFIASGLKSISNKKNKEMERDVFYILKLISE